MIVYDEDDENAPILLTEKGFSRQKCSALRNFLITSPKKWDHLWRVIIFDISEKRGVRRVFQKHLRAMGCFPLQRSVYAYPYDCIENIKYLAAQYRISAYVTLLTVPHLGQHEKPAREYYFSRFHKHFR